MASSALPPNARRRVVLRERSSRPVQIRTADEDSWGDWYAETRRRLVEDRTRVAVLQREADQQWAEWYRTAHPDPGPAAARTGRRRLLDRGLRFTGGFFILVACLVLPWLLPWPGTSEEPLTADPPSLLLPDSGTDVGSTNTAPDTRPDTPPDAGAIERLRATTLTQAAGYDVPVSSQALAAVRTTPGPYRKLGRLDIPSLSLSVTYAEGVSAEILDKGPGHWPGTPAPGGVGNAVLSGHRNTHTQPFKELDELDPGDTITTSYDQRTPTTFEVVKTTIVPESDYKEFVLRQPADPRARHLTLFACHPEGNPVFRIVVEARAQP